jgi:hypothetical protein
MYVEPYEFLPVGTLNTLRSAGAWNKQSNLEWEKLVSDLEDQGMGVIKVRVNLKDIQDEEELLRNLLTQFVLYKLLLPLIHMETLRENGQYAYEQFETMLQEIKENQAEAGIIADEENGVPNDGLIVFT